MPINEDIFNSFPILKTRRLLLREIREEDTLAIYEMRNSKRIAQFIARPESQTMNEAEAFVEILETKVDHKFEEAKEILTTKQGMAELEVRLTRTIYTVGVVQYLAILASVIAIIKFLH